MTRYVWPLIAVIVILPIFWLGLGEGRNVNELQSQYIGKAAPEFDLPTLKDPMKRLSNKDLSGQVSLVNVWATWCAGCRAEHAFLMELFREGSIPIFAINWRDNRQAALTWLSQLGDPYAASGFDEDARVGIDWGVYGAPETFLISQQGNVVYRHAGPLNRTIWDREFLPRIEGMSQ